MSVKIDKVVRFHRKKAGLSQAALAEMAGLGKTVVFDIEKGKLTVRLNTLLKIFKILNIEMTLNSPLMHLIEVENEGS